MGSSQWSDEFYGTHTSVAEHSHQHQDKCSDCGAPCNGQCEYCNPAPLRIKVAPEPVKKVRSADEPHWFLTTMVVVGVILIIASAGHLPVHSDQC